MMDEEMIGLNNDQLSVKTNVLSNIHINTPPLSLHKDTENDPGQNKLISEVEDDDDIFYQVISKSGIKARKSINDVENTTPDKKPKIILLGSSPKIDGYSDEFRSLESQLSKPVLFDNYQENISCRQSYTPNLGINEKQNTYDSPSDEFNQYHTMIENYRESVRRKNTMIRSLEKELIELKRIAISPKCASSNVDKDNNKLYKDNKVLKNENDNIKKSKICKSAVMDGFTDIERNIIEDLKAEVKSKDKVIEILTEENNQYRVKEFDNLKKIDDLKIELKLLHEKNNEEKTNMRASEDEINNLRMSFLSISSSHELLKHQVSKLENDNEVKQIKISELYLDIREIEKENQNLTKENETLQKLLSNAREVGIASISKIKSCSSLNDHEDLTKSWSYECDSETNKKSMDSQSSSFISSLEHELKLSRNREKELRNFFSQEIHRLKGKTDIEEAEKLFKDDLSTAKYAILEKVSESQQEAVNYLYQEIDELRRSLNSENEKKKDVAEESLKMEAKIQCLQTENQSFASKIISLESEVDELRSNISIKLGENACLRDEIHELETKILKNDELEKNVNQKNFECQELKQALHEINISDVNTIVHKKEKFVDILASNVDDPDDICDETSAVSSLEALEEIPLTSTYTVPRDSKITKNREVVHVVTQAVSNSVVSVKDDLKNDVDIRKDAGLKEYSVLKKALKQSYDKKFRDLETATQHKNHLIEKLNENIMQLEKKVISQQDEISQHISRRISLETDLQNELENLSNNLLARERELHSTKQKLYGMKHKSIESGSIFNLRNSEMNWQEVSSSLSDTVRSGVDASLNFFKLNFGDDLITEARSRPKGHQSSDSELKNCHIHHHPLRSSKSFG